MLDHPGRQTQNVLLVPTMIPRRTKRNAKGMDAETPVLPLRRSTRHQTKSSLPTKEPTPEPVPIPIPSSPLPVAKSSKVSNVATPAKTQVLSPIVTLPSKLPNRLPGLTKRGIDLLHYKQRRLRSPTSQLHHLEEFCPPGSVEYRALETAANATLVFAQEESVGQDTNFQALSYLSYMPLSEQKIGHGGLHIEGWATPNLFALRRRVRRRARHD
jgi:hypothetical protein